MTSRLLGIFLFGNIVLGVSLLRGSAPEFFIFGNARYLVPHVFGATAPKIRFQIKMPLAMENARFCHLPEAGRPGEIELNLNETSSR